MRLLIAGLGDGAIHAIKPQTGEKVWSFVASKRAINTGVVVKDNTVFVSHGDENLDGQRARADCRASTASQTGDIKTTKWAVKGIEFAFSSPLVDGTRLYQIDGGSTLHAFDIETGKELWELPLGTAQKAPPVIADGKIYVGTDNGKFFIIRPRRRQGEILSTVELPNSTNSCCGSEGTPEQILAGAAISRGRIFFVSSDAVYAIGPKRPRRRPGFAVDEPAAAGAGAPAYVQVSPTELVLDARADREAARAAVRRQGPLPSRGAKATWSLDGLKGTVDGRQRSSSAADPVEQAGLIKATVGSLTGQARARVVASAAVEGDLRVLRRRRRAAGWVNATAGKLSVTTLDGQKVLQKAPRRHDLQARPRVHRPDHLVQLHVRGRRSRADAPPADGRRRHHRAALFARALRQLAEAEDRAVGAGNDAHGHGAVHLEAGHLVSPEAARREPAERRRCARRARPGPSAKPNRRRG